MSKTKLGLSKKLLSQKIGTQKYRHKQKGLISKWVSKWVSTWVSKWVSE